LVDLNTKSQLAAENMVAGTAKSMGFEIVD